MAAEQLDTWKTTFMCGGRTFVVESHCKPSITPMTLNYCAEGQQKVLNGTNQVALPYTSPAKGKPALFAVLWSCVSVQAVPYIALTYASGQGQGEEDESAEVFDLNLKFISNYALQVEVFRQEAKGMHGRVRSIFPDGEGTK